MIWTGGAALLAATAIDTIAVIGRQVGYSVHGAIELIQAAILVAGSLALLTGSAWVAADLWNSHEVSEVAGVPWRWMRLAANLALATMLVLTLRELVRRREP